MSSLASTRSAAKNKTFRIPVNLASRAEAKARRTQRSLNAVVVELLQGFVGVADEGDFFTRIEAIRQRALRRRGGKALTPARPFSRDELHER